MSSSWPSFAEMASSAAAVAAKDKDKDYSYVSDPESVSDVMMDYTWNEDDVDLDFITGE